MRVRKKKFLHDNNSDASLQKVDTMVINAYLSTYTGWLNYLTYLFKTYKNETLYHYIDGKLVLLVISSNHKNIPPFLKFALTPERTL